MKEICKLYAAYNLWANQKMVELVTTLTPEEQQQILPSSFDSVLKTMLHMWDAESIWWQRLKLTEQIIRPSDAHALTMEDAVAGLIQQSKQWMEWTENASQPMLEHVFAYRNTKREEFKQPTFQMLMHVFNHGTYHRGQLVNMCRQLGKNKIPATDFAMWSRGRK